MIYCYHERDAINKFYVVQDAAYVVKDPSQLGIHIWRVKVAPLTDTQEYVDILGSDDPRSKNDISTYQAEINISDAIVESQENANQQTYQHLFGRDEAEQHMTLETLETGDRSISQ